MISSDYSDGVVLAKVMEAAKEIRPGDKNAGPLRLVAGRLLAFLGARGARRKGRRRGDGLPGMDGAGNDPAAIRRYLISH